MKKRLAILLTAAGLVSACGAGAARPVANTNAGAGTAGTPRADVNEKPQTVTAHSTEGQFTRSGNSNAGSSAPGKWTASGDPIDTATFDTAIADAEKALKGKPADADAKKALANAYYQRGVALINARQYASALGDYRRAVKLDPSDDASQGWIEQITSIYQMLKKDPPKEGEEPPPLPFKKS